MNSSLKQTWVLTSTEHQQNKTMPSNITIFFEIIAVQPHRGEHGDIERQVAEGLYLLTFHDPKDGWFFVQETTTAVFRCL